MSIDDIDRNRGASRRDFIKTATAAAGIYWLGPTLMFRGKAIAAIPGGSLDPTNVAKFVRPLVISPVMPPTDENLVVRGGKNVSYYEIAVHQFQQEILPVGNYPQTKVWSYCSANNRAGTLNYPAFNHRDHL